MQRNQSDVMSPSFKSLLIVIPSRNRASLATNAIRSVLDQGNSVVKVVVSDNSTDVRESSALRGFCKEQRTDRLRYLRPPEPLSMTRHWQWAIEQVLDRYDSSHFAYLTDRMVLRPGEVDNLVEIAKTHPAQVISYNHDRVVDFEQPVRVEQSFWTGRVFRLETAVLLRLTADAFLAVPAYPRMLNCIVPRSILDAIQRRYGNVFDSVNPDFSFCYRCLESLDSVLFYDKSPLIHYALDRSNGASFERGVPGPDHLDFLNHVKDDELTGLTYVPQLRTVGNAILNEYCLVRQQTGSPRFPEIDRDLYLHNLAIEIERMADPDLRARMWNVLAEHGYMRSAHRTARLKRFFSRLRSPKRILKGLLWLSTGSFGGRIWLALAHRSGVRPPAVNRLRFDTVEQALEYAVRFPPRKSRTARHLSYLGESSRLRLA